MANIFWITTMLNQRSRKRSSETGYRSYLQYLGKIYSTDISINMSQRVMNQTKHCCTRVRHAIPQFKDSALNCKFEYRHPVMYWSYIDIIAFNISQMKITAVSQWTATFDIQRKPEKCWCLLRLTISLLDCLTAKEIAGLFQDFSKISAKFQDFPGLFSNSRTFQDWWELCSYKCVVKIFF